MDNSLLRFAIWIPALPFLVFAINVIFIRNRHRTLGASLSVLGTLGSLVTSVAVALDYHLKYGGQASPVIPTNWHWMSFPLGPTRSLEAYFGILLDPISILLALVVSFISLLVQTYSLEYLKEEPGFARFFTFISLFTGAMLGLVLANNLFQVFFFWELMGLGSFLLIGFYYKRPAAVDACKKAFIVTRFADLGLLIGVVLLSYNAGTFDILELSVVAHRLPLLTLSCFMIFIGAAGKSAMFPLHVWLPDAMEGPTPVSALLHAATMVVAGVFLVARLHGVFIYAPGVLDFVAQVGIFTALFAAVIACTQKDFKRVLAYSTLSQIGYMMAAIGSSDVDNPLGYTASMFHLTTHAFFKALLFLSAGAVIHAVHTNDITQMGGLRKKMPVTHLSFLIACIAITGVLPFSGFYSKEEILLNLSQSHHPIMLLIATCTSALTSFYIFRLYYLVFGGPTEKANPKAHDPGALMLLPLLLLAVMSICGGYLHFSDYVRPTLARALPHYGMNLNLALPAFTLSLIGLFLARIFYKERSAIPTGAAQAFGDFYRCALAKFYVDELYLFITKKIIFDKVSRPLERFDDNIVDGTVDRVGEATLNTGGDLAAVSTGRLSYHALTVSLGVAAVIVLIWITLPLGS